MPELQSSKSNVGTTQTSIFALFSNAIFKIFIWILAIIISLSFLIPRFVPVEKIIPMPEINRIIYNKTGLEVKISGKARLSILPFFGITAHDFTVLNPSFEEKNLISAKKIDIKIALLPMIFNRLVIKNIILENANIDIIKCNNSYNFLPTHSLIDNKIKQETTSKLSTKFDRIALTHLKISNSNVSYKICNTDVHHKISSIDAKVSMPNYDSKIKANASIHLDNHNLSLKLQLSSLNELLHDHMGEASLFIKSELGDATIEAKYTTNPANPLFFDTLKLEGSATNILVGDIAKKMQTANKFLQQIPPIDLNIKAELLNRKLDISNFAIKSQHFSITSQGIHGIIDDTPLLSYITGTLVANIVDTQNFCNTFEIDTKKLTNIPQEVNAQLDFTIDKGIVQTAKTSYLKFNDTTLNIASVWNFLTQSKSASVDITGVDINLDNYISTQKTAPESMGVGKNDARIFLPQPLSIPLELKIAMKSITYRKAVFKDVTSLLKSEQDLLHFNLQGLAFGGFMEINGEASQKDGALEKVLLKSSAKNVEIGDIMKFLNRKTALNGTTNWQANIVASGSNMTELQQSSSGVASFDVVNPTIYGVDVKAIIADAKKDYRKIFSGNIKEKYFLSTMQSKIDGISGKVTIANGVLTNDFLTAKKDAFTFNIYGEMNVINGDLNYTITPSKSSLPLPSLKLGGTTQNITYSIDASSYIRQSAKMIADEDFSNPETQEKLKKLKKLFNNIKK